MKLSIKTLTSDCSFEHKCLENTEFKPCEVKECVNEKILFVKSNHRMCDYSFNFGNEKVCWCPTRKEIFEKYNL